MEDAENYEFHEMEEIKDHQEDDHQDDDYQDDDYQDDDLQDEQSTKPGEETATVSHDGQIAETSFSDPIDKETLNRIVNGIENKNLKEKVKLTIEADSNEKGEASAETLKNALLDGISDLEMEDRLIKDRWINKNSDLAKLEKEDRLTYNQILNHVNEALENDKLFISDKDEKAFELIKHFKELKTKSGKLVRGYAYNGKEIIVRRETKDKEGKNNTNLNLRKTRQRIK